MPSAAIGPVPRPAAIHALGPVRPIRSAALGPVRAIDAAAAGVVGPVAGGAAALSAIGRAGVARACRPFRARRQRRGQPFGALDHEPAVVVATGETRKLVPRERSGNGGIGGEPEHTYAQVRSEDVAHIPFDDEAARGEVARP